MVTKERRDREEAPGSGYSSYFDRGSQVRFALHGTEHTLLFTTKDEGRSATCIQRVEMKMLPNIQYTEQTPTTKNCLLPDISSAKAEKS